MKYLYLETTLPKDEPLEVAGEDVVEVRILDVRPVGPDLSWKYVVIGDA